MERRSTGLAWMTALTTAILWLAPAMGAAQSGRLDLGLRGILLVADGEPANDIPGQGVFAHYQLGQRWWLGVAVDRAEYDFEQPAKIVGIAQDPALEPVDVLAESTTLSLWLERRHLRQGSAMSWFWGAGLGLASIDVPDAVAARADGGTFHVRTEVSTEVIAGLTAGLRRDLGRRWFVELGLHAEQHFADWQLTDTVSGARGAVDDYFTMGGHLGVGFRF